MIRPYVLSAATPSSPINSRLSHPLSFLSLTLSSCTNLKFVSLPSSLNDIGCCNRRQAHRCTHRANLITLPPPLLPHPPPSQFQSHIYSHHLSPPPDLIRPFNCLSPCPTSPLRLLRLAPPVTDILAANAAFSAILVLVADVGGMSLVLCSHMPAVAADGCVSIGIRPPRLVASFDMNTVAQVLKRCTEHLSSQSPIPLLRCSIKELSKR